MLANHTLYMDDEALNEYTSFEREINEQMQIESLHW